MLVYLGKYQGRVAIPTIVTKGEHQLQAIPLSNPADSRPPSDKPLKKPHVQDARLEKSQPLSPRPNDLDDW